MALNFHKQIVAEQVANDGLTVIGDRNVCNIPLGKHCYCQTILHLNNENEISF